MNFKAFRKKSLLKRTLLLMFVTLALGCTNSFAQGLIKGIVKDATGATLPGVSVTVKGSSATSGGITDVDGRYSVKASPKDVLVFSYIGMKTLQVTVGNRKQVDVTMEDNVSSLNEVIVVGYGTAKKQSLTGAVSAMKGDDLLKAPSTNVSSLLGGRLPGIASLQTSGQPGDDQAALTIRGSYTGATYIVDGMPRSINDVDPNDIESVSVLKDGASAAVYGLGAAGGVIIITTKKGKEGKTKITYDGQFGASMNANFPKFMNGPEFADYYNMADMMDKLASGAIASREDYTPVFTRKDVQMMLNNDPTDGWDNVNYIKKVFGTGFNMKHNVTFTGGNKDLNYFLSLGYMDQKGNIDNFNYKRYNVRTNIESSFGKGFKLSFGAVGTVSRLHTPRFNAGGSDTYNNGDTGFLSIAHQAIQMHPYLPMIYNGLYTSTLINNASIPYSPLAAINQSGYKKTEGFDLQSNFTLQYDAPWLKGLTLKFTGSYDWGTSHNKNLSTRYQTYMMTDITNGTYKLQDDPEGLTADKPNKLGEGQYTTQQMVGQYSVEYAHAFGKHNVDAMGLLEMRDWKCNDLSAYVKNLPVVQLPELGLGTADDDPVGGYSGHTRTAGYVFRLKYDYDNKYLAEFSGRYDGSYKFNGNVSSKRWGFFPAVSVGWRLSSEEFMKKFTWLDDLKLRASVGLMGDDAVTAYSYLSNYAFGGKRIIGGIAQSSVYTASIANPYLTWSKTRSSNIGFDATLWGGKLGVEFDVFYNYTYDMLSGMSGGHSLSMGGYYMTYANNNKMDSKGYEIVLTHRNKFLVDGKPFNYNVGVNASYAKNRWLKYTDDANEPECQKVTGKSVYANYGWVAEGLFRDEDDITNSPWYSTRPNLGDIKYKDLNGDGKIDNQDRARIGKDNLPRFTYGLNLGANWNGFDFNAQFTGGLNFDVSMTGTYGNGYDDNTIWTQTFKEGANSPLFLVQKSYSIDNPNGKYPRLTLSHTTHGGDNGLASTFWFRKGDYIRMKSLQFGYTFPQKWMSFLGIDKLRLYFEGSNLFTIDSLPDGMDPESPQVNNGYYPQQKTLMGGISLTF